MTDYEKLKLELNCEISKAIESIELDLRLSQRCLKNGRADMAHGYILDAKNTLNELEERLP